MGLTTACIEEHLLGSEERTPVPRVQARTLDQQAGAEVAAAILHHGCHTDKLKLI